MGANAPVAPGDLIAEKYRVEQVLGSGGMGVVVAATHLKLDERVAIKFLLGDAASDREATERFAREARAAVKIKSEHVVRVMDVGTLENGAPFMVMELLRGKDLAKTLRERKRLPIEEAVDYVVQCLSALSEAHILGIVHRDLKPANLFLTRRRDGSQCVKILDFGISKSTKGEHALTGSGNVFGSPRYMAPEQWVSARDVDARADIWSMGAILYELCSGDAPFDGESVAQLFTAIRDGEPRKLTHAPEEIERIVLRCLAKKREDRYANVGELALALAPHASPPMRHLADRISSSSDHGQEAPTPSVLGTAATRPQISELARSVGEVERPAEPTAILPETDAAIAEPATPQSAPEKERASLEQQEPRAETGSPLTQTIDRPTSRRAPILLAALVVVSAIVALSVWSTKSSSTSTHEAPSSSPPMVESSPVGLLGSETPPAKSIDPEPSASVASIGSAMKPKPTPSSTSAVQRPIVRAVASTPGSAPLATAVAPPPSAPSAAPSSSRGSLGGRI